MTIYSTPPDDLLKVAQEEIANLRRQVADLKAQLAQQQSAMQEMVAAAMEAGEWRPVPDGFYWDGPHLTYIRVSNDLLRTGHDYDPGCEVQLAKDIRLCRRVSQAQEGES